MSNRQTPISGDRLVRIDAVLARHVAAGDVPGAVALLHRHGETYAAVVGRQSLGGRPMRRDSIFRIASITKPITAALAMMLIEDGLLRLDDPVDPLLPELANRQVLRSIDADLTDTVPASRPITLRDLLTMRCGLGAIMTWPSVHPIQKAMEERGVAPGPDLYADTAHDLMRRLGELPLIHQPGEGFLYDTGLLIAGVLIERATGKRLSVAMQERIFDPLGMEDTGFHVPNAKLDRFVTFYQKGEAGNLVVRDEPRGRFSRIPAIDAGNGGLVSTVDDYLAFARMMLDGGVYGRRRLLSRPSIALMTRDHIQPHLKTSEHARFFVGEHRGWGLGMAVDLRRDNIEMSPGRFGWDGGYGTSAYVDPAEGLIGILFTQRMMDSPAMPDHLRDFWTAAYAAIND